MDVAAVIDRQKEKNKLGDQWSPLQYILNLISIIILSIDKFELFIKNVGADVSVRPNKK